MGFWKNLRWIYTLLFLNNSVTPEIQSNSTELLLNKTDETCNFTGTRCDVETSDSPNTNQNCRCDPQCSMYGDCCSTSKYRRNDDYKRYAEFSCRQPFLISWSSEYLYVKDKCPVDWPNDRTSEMCNKSRIEPKSVNALIFAVPVYGLDDRQIIYGNAYCAECNRQEEYERLDVIMSPVSEDEWVEEEQFKLTQYLAYENNSWTTKVDNKTVRVYLDINWNITGRYCHPNVVSRCDSEFENSELSTNCSSDMSVIHGPDDKSYRNRYCALCNNVSFERLTYCKLPLLQSPFSPPFSRIFDIPVGDYRPKMEIYRCGSKANERIAYVKGVMCVVAYFHTSQVNITSDDILIVPNVTANFTKDRYVKKSRTYIVCQREVNLDCNSSPPANIVTTICLAISVFCLIVHLSLFFTIKRSRCNFANQNLASYSFALLSAYAFFTLGGSVRDSGCVIVAVITYYFFLASFFWTLTMSFDVWKSFWNATKNLRLTNDASRLTGRFIFYSFFSWSSPLLLVSVAITLDNYLDDSWNRLKPEFGTSVCWFGNSDSLIYLFVIPFSTIMVINTIFFAHVTWMLNSTRADRSITSTRAYDFRTYLRLFVLMGLTWTTAFAAIYWKYPTLWMAFIILNAGQGVFILVAFSLKRHVFNNIADRLSEFTTKVSFATEP